MPRPRASGYLIAQPDLVIDQSLARGKKARFFAENFAVKAGALERTVIEGADSVDAAAAALE